MIHKDLSLLQVHNPFRWVYTSETTRLADTSFTVADLYKLAIQESDFYVYMLTDWEIPTWTAVREAVE